LSARPSQLVDAALTAEVNRPFDLQQGPLTRLSVFRLSDQSLQVVLTSHAIVADSWSMSLLMPGPAGRICFACLGSIVEFPVFRLLVRRLCRLGAEARISAVEYSLPRLLETRIAGRARTIGPAHGSRASQGAFAERRRIRLPARRRARGAVAGRFGPTRHLALCNSARSLRDRAPSRVPSNRSAGRNQRGWTTACRVAGDGGKFLKSRADSQQLPDSPTFADVIRQATQRVAATRDYPPPPLSRSSRN
jgi:hypothetical protein